MEAGLLEKTVNEIDWPYNFQILPLNEMFIDERYQRPANNVLANRIAKNFDPALVVALVVADRGDKYAIIDGQTRRIGMKKLLIPTAPCLVYDNLTLPDEANMFIRFQEERKKIMPYDRFRAAILAEDPTATEIKEIMDQFGYEFSRGGLDKDAQSKYITAVRAFERAYKRDVLTRMLRITSAAWHPLSKENHLTSEIIGGLIWWMRKNPDADDSVITEILQDSGSSELLERSSQLRKGMGQGGGSGNYMGQVLDIEYKRATK